MAKVEIVAERCKSCGYCIKFCRKNVNSKGYEYVEPIHPEDCVGCAICAKMCPDGAIDVYK